jgi:uncharacterized protein
MNYPFFRFALLLALVVGATAVAARAQDLAAVRQRMEQRLPALDALRQQGALGENNRGFTEVRQATGDAARISQEENNDRETVYAAIARQQSGVTADQVGRARARQIAQSSAPGVWLQRESGEWYRK